MGKTFKDMTDRPRKPRRTKSEKIREDRAAWNKQALVWLAANPEDESPEADYFEQLRMAAIHGNSGTKET